MKVLYTVYWGLMEQLGQSLVMPPLELLAADGCRLVVVSFEKPADLARKGDVAAVARRLEEAGITWIPRGYTKRPPLLSTLWDITAGFWTAARAARHHGCQLVHGRTFVGGIIAWMVAASCRMPWIYHAEGFWPDEQVDSGVWREGSPIHRLARWIDHRMYLRATAVMVLSPFARQAVKELPGRDTGKEILVIPSCVDLRRFPRPDSNGAPAERVGFLYLGSLGGRYPLTDILRVMQLSAKRFPGARQTIITRFDARQVIAAAEGLGMDAAALEVKPASAHEVPTILARNQVGVCIMRPGITSRNGSPTKAGEYLAAGMAVLATPGYGDLDAILQEYRAGVILESLEPGDIATALARLADLMKDPALPERCRTAAKEHFGLTQAVDQTYNLYRSLAKHG